MAIVSIIFDQVSYIHVHVYFSNIFETAWPIKAKFHVAHLWEGGRRIFIDGPGQMTKMATTSIDGKTFKTSPEPNIL